jgi:hypothetical protein
MKPGQHLPALDVQTFAASFVLRKPLHLKRIHSDRQSRQQSLAIEGARRQSQHVNQKIGIVMFSPHHDCCQFHGARRRQERGESL